MEFLREAYNPVFEIIRSGDWAEVISGILVLLMSIVYPIWGINWLVKKFFPMTYKRFSGHFDQWIEHAIERVMRVVAPIIMIGGVGSVVWMVSEKWPGFLWPAIVLGVVFLMWFYDTQKH